MELALLKDIVILLGVSLVVLYVSHGLRLPVVVGFLVTGILVGPNGLGLVSELARVRQLAEVGVILVLFAIGMEFSLKDFLRMRRTILLGGSLQVFGTIGVVAAVLVAGRLPAPQAVFLGMIASLSSTAVILALLQQRAEVDAPHGRTAVAVSIYQDLMIIPMLLLVPLLTGSGGGVVPALGGFVVKAVAVLVLVLVMARMVVPRLLEKIVGTQSRDMFLMAVVSIGLLVAWGAQELGLSLAMGAFLAGLIISESEYSHQALSDILPFRDLFASFFFISIGMLLDVGFALASPLLLLALVGGLIVVKLAVSTLAVLAVGLSLRAAVIAGVSLSQVGEFSFILAGTGVREGIMGPESYQWFLVAAVASIGASALLMPAAPRLAGALERLPLPARFRLGSLAPHPEGAGHQELSDHVVVVGFGVNGRNVARAARVAGIPLVAIEMNPSVVREERAAGVNIHFGDASQAAMLDQARIQKARVAVVAISDAAATRRVVALVRALNPACQIIARTRYLREMEPLQAAGAHLVIPEELETSLEIVARVLASYLVPRRDIEGFLAEVRAGGYEMLRSPHGTAPSMADLQLALSDMEISTLKVDAGSAVAGRRLDETDLRKLYGITVVAIRRGEDVLSNPGGDTVVQAGDALIVLGLSDEVNAASELFGTLTEG